MSLLPALCCVPPVCGWPLPPINRLSDFRYLSVVKQIVFRSKIIPLPSRIYEQRKVEKSSDMQLKIEREWLPARGRREMFARAIMSLTEFLSPQRSRCLGLSLTVDWHREENPCLVHVGICLNCSLSAVHVIVIAMPIQILTVHGIPNYWDAMSRFWGYGDVTAT